MTRYFMLAAAAAVLAACGSDGAGGVNEAGEPAPANAAAPPPAKEAAASSDPGNALSAEPRPLQAIPPAFHGVYDADRNACAGPSEYRLTVTAAEMRFHESIATVRSVVADGADTIRVAADYQGEGESWSNVRTLRLTDGGMTLTLTGEGTSLRRARCD